MHERTIIVRPSCFSPEFEMTIGVPDERDDEDYIDDLLEGILSEEFRYCVDWEFY